MLYYIIYQSIPSSEVTQEVVDQITKESINWNTPRNITGILLYHDGKFLQYIEGDEDEVVKVFELIRKDSRHHTIEQKVVGYTKERVFSEWSMGSWIIGKGTPIDLTLIENLDKYMADPIKNELESRKYIGMMQGIMKQWIEQDQERSTNLKNSPKE